MVRRAAALVVGVERVVTKQVDVVSIPAFEAVYERLWWPMYRLAAGLVDDRVAAEDVVQEAFTAVYRRWDSIRDPEAAPGYVRAAVLNAARSSIRRRAVARKHRHALFDESVEAADHTVLLGADHHLVRSAMALLPERQREVLVLRFVSQLSDAEIAEATGLSEGGVRSASSRALATLRTTLEGQL
jgi:RNA polymerase sigma-70 factor (sigma-E family)